MVAAEAGLGRFGTIAIDGTKIAANASIDANRGKEWFDRQAAGVVADAEDTDGAEDAAARDAPDAGTDRVPASLGDRTRRAERIRLAAEELRTQLQRRARADEDRRAAAHVVAGLSKASRSSGGSRTGHTVCRKRAHILLGRSLRIRPSSTGMPL
jgi:hypothetical protein